jgi:hypothetical protein
MWAQASGLYAHLKIKFEKLDYRVFIEKIVESQYKNKISVAYYQQSTPFI